MDPLRRATIRLAHAQPAGSKLRQELLNVIAASEGRTAADLPSEEKGGKKSYDDDFKAGFLAGKAALKKNPDADASVGAKAYKRVSSKHGSWWKDGFNAAVDMSRGASATKPAQIAKKMKLAFGWSDEDIIDYYDENPDVTLRELARMTMRTVSELKRILMPGRRAGSRKQAGKNGYIAFYKGKKMEVHADTSLEARDIAAEKFRARRPYDVTVVLAEKGGKQVTHDPLFASSGVRADFDADEIGDLEPDGALENDAEEVYMDDNFTEQEFDELSDKQESGKLPYADAGEMKVGGGHKTYKDYVSDWKKMKQPVKVKGKMLTKEQWEANAAKGWYGKDKKAADADLRKKLIRLAFETPSLRPHLLSMLDKSASVPGNLQSLLKGDWVEVSSEPVVAIRYHRGSWGAIMRSGLINSYRDEGKFIYQLKNSMQVPSREAERAFRALREKVNSKMAGFDPNEISELESGGALQFDMDEPYMGENFTEQETMELLDKQESGMIPGYDPEPMKYAGDEKLRAAAIKLAFENPELREYLLPLVASASKVAEVGQVADKATVDRAIGDFVKSAQKTLDAYNKKQGYNTKTELSIAWGRRYAKIIKSDSGGQQSVFGFVDRINGNLLKAASWKAPAKHARGNVLDKSTWQGSHGPWGMAYMR